jgi:hypothetical protein
MALLMAGKDYPKNRVDFNAWFLRDAECLDYLDWLRWPHGFVCEVCDPVGGAWRTGDGRYMCRDLSDRGNDLPPYPDAAHYLVHHGLGDGIHEERLLGPRA